MAYNILVAYDLNVVGQNYTKIINAIQTFPRWAKIQQSVWYIKSDIDSQQVYNLLIKSLDANDSLFVTEMNAAAWLIDKDQSDFLHSNWHS